MVLSWETSGVWVQSIRAFNKVKSPRHMWWGSWNTVVSNKRPNIIWVLKRLLNANQNSAWAALALLPSAASCPCLGWKCRPAVVIHTPAPSGYPSFPATDPLSPVSAARHRACSERRASVGTWTRERGFLLVCGGTGILTHWRNSLSSSTFFTRKHDPNLTWDVAPGRLYGACAALDWVPAPLQPTP